MSKYFSMLYTQEDGYFNHIEGLRALAGLWVFFFHIAFLSLIVLGEHKFAAFSQSNLFKAALSSTVSLDIFFIITGLVVGYSLIKQYKNSGKVNIYSFLVRRIARVYPMYILLLVLCMPVSMPTIKNMWANLLQVNNILPSTQQYLLWTWSLAVDFQFYTVFAVLLWLLSAGILHRKIFIGFVVGLFFLPIICTPILMMTHQITHMTNQTIIITSAQHHQYFDLLFDKSYVRSGPIFFGLSCAYILVYHRNLLHVIIDKLSSRQVNFMAIILIGLITFALYNDPIWSIHNNVVNWQTNMFWAVVGQRDLFSLSICAFILLADHPKGFLIQYGQKILSSVIWRPLGQLTFCVYLIHPPILMVGSLFYTSAHPNCTVAEFMRNGVWLMVVSYLLAIPCYLFVEQPAMQRIKNVLLKRKANLYANQVS